MVVFSLLRFTLQGAKVLPYATIFYRLSSYGKRKLFWNRRCHQFSCNGAQLLLLCLYNLKSVSCKGPVPCCITCCDDLYVVTCLFTLFEMKNSEAMEKLGNSRIRFVHKDWSFIFIFFVQYLFFLFLQDYQFGTAIHEIHLETSSIKDIGKCRLQLATPYHPFM